MIGRIRPRPGWPARQDGRYQTPTSWRCCGRTIPAANFHRLDRLNRPTSGRSLRGGLLRHHPRGRGRQGETSEGGRLAQVPSQRHGASLRRPHSPCGGRLCGHVSSTGPVRLWGHDLMNAYRQWPVKVPSHSGAILQTASGHSLWFHRAMCFGAAAAASVWNFNGAGDALQFLTRALLFLVGGHCVDDFNGVDATDLADSAFYGFADFFLLMGLRTKPSKAQEPGRSHVVQGVQLSLGHDGAALAPTRKRLKKILTIIDAAVQENRLTPETAHRLAGKLNFVNQTVFGKVGRAAVAPIYARSGAHSGKPELTPGLRAALLATAALLQQVPPRLVPFTAPQAVNCVVYADAFFLEGELRHKAGWVPANAPMAHPHRSANGWGYVVRVGDIAWYDCGSVPAWFVRKFDTRRAYIYMLEVLAQILAVVTLADILGEDWVAFIDNAASVGAQQRIWSRPIRQRPPVRLLVAGGDALMVADLLQGHFGGEHRRPYITCRLHASHGNPGLGRGRPGLCHPQGGLRLEHHLIHFSGAAAAREKGRRAGCRSAPPAPGYGASADPPPIPAIPTA